MLRIFYIEYFSTFGGDFVPIVLRNCGLALLCWDYSWLVDGLEILLVGWCKLKNDQTARCHNVVL